MRSPLLFTERNLGRVLRTLKKAGITGRVEIDRMGTIAIITNDRVPLEPQLEADAILAKLK